MTINNNIDIVWIPLDRNEDDSILFNIGASIYGYYFYYEIKLYK